MTRPRPLADAVRRGWAWATATPGRFTALLMAATAAALVLAWQAHARCAGLPAVRIPKIVCASDIARLYTWRGLDHRLVPYVQAFNEYPPVTGMLQYLVALVSWSTPSFFAANAIVLGLMAFATARVLQAHAGPRPRLLLWALAPTLPLYAFLNWDLLTVLLVACGLLCFARNRNLAAGILLGLGVAAKWYPAVLLPPLALVLWRREGRVGPQTLRLGLGAVGAVVAAHLPFLLLNPRLLLESYTFHAQRAPNYESIWYAAIHYAHLWGLPAPLRAAGRLALALSLPAALAGSVLLGGRVAKGRIPWLQACLGAVALFMLVNKIYSVQYALWLLPFLALLEVPWTPMLLFFVADGMVLIRQGGVFVPHPGVGFDASYAALAPWLVLRSAALAWILVWSWRNRPGPAAAEPTVRRLLPACWALAAVVAVALAVRLWNLGPPSLWVDEAYSFNVAHRGLAGVLADRDQTPPLYVLFLHFWMKLAGTSELALRLPSALFGTAAVGLAYPVALRFGDRRAALLATALLALSVYNIVESQDARTYSLFLLATLASVHQMLRLHERWTRGRAAAYVACTALMLYSHVYGVFFLLAEALYGLLFVPPDPAWRRRWLLTLAGAAALFLPWAGILVQRTLHVAAGFWLSRPGLAQLEWAPIVLSGSRVMAALVSLALLLALWQAWRGRGARDAAWMQRAWLWAWLLLPILVPFAVAQAVPIYLAKYFLPASVPLAILAAGAVMRLPRPAWIAAAAVLVLAAAVTVAAFHAGGEAEDSKQDWRSAADLIDSQAAHGETVLFNTGYCDSARSDDLQCAFKLYSNRTDLRFVPFLANDVPVGAGNVGQLDPILAGQQRVWVVHGYVTDPQDLIGQRLAREFTRAGHWEPKHLVVDLWVRG